MGYNTAEGNPWKYCIMGVSVCHVGFLLSFSRELGLMAVKVAQIVLHKYYTSITSQPLRWQFPSSIFLNNSSPAYGHTCPLPPPSFSMRVDTQATCEPPTAREHSAPDALKTLELGESWSPHVYGPAYTCTASGGSAIHPFLTEPALRGNEGWKITFLHQMLQHHLHKMYLSFNTVHSPEDSHKNGASSCLDGPIYHLPLIFGFCQYKQDFLQWYSWAGKMRYGDRKKYFWRDRIPFFTCTAWTEIFVLTNPI